jgi:hypothetical protein
VEGPRTAKLREEEKSLEVEEDMLKVPKEERMQPD